MNDTQKIGEESGGQAYPATVAEVFDHGMVILNRGVSHGVREGQRFLIYEPNERDRGPRKRRDPGPLGASQGNRNGRERSG